MAYTNPGSIIRFSSRKGGRASIYENNAQYQQHSTGVFSGSGVTQNTSADMNIIVGGALGTSGSNGYIPAASPANPNVLIGKNANGYKIMLDVVGTTLLQITKPAQNSRISLVVAYTDDLSIQSTETSDTGNPAKNGIIVVNGQSLANPVPPSDSDIRTAITADGAAGSQAVYAIIARITVASNTTTITNTMIAVDNATIPDKNISFTKSNGMWSISGGIGNWGQNQTNSALSLQVPVIAGKKYKVDMNVVSTNVTVGNATVVYNPIVNNVPGTISQPTFRYQTVSAGSQGTFSGTYVFIPSSSGIATFTSGGYITVGNVANNNESIVVMREPEFIG